MKKKILITVFALIAVVGLFIAATPKSQPPNFETAFTTFGDLLDDYLEARGNNSSDTTTIKAALVSAINYLHANWTDSQVEENVNALWPHPIAFVAACVAHCRKAYYLCIGENYGYSPGIAATCNEDYQECTSHCHY